MTTNVRSLDHGIQTTVEWLRDVAEALGTDDRHYAYRALRAHLHVLRDRLAVDEAAQVAAQLPNLLRGIYYEGWNPSATPTTIRHERDFLEQVAAEGRFAGTTEAGTASRAVASVLRRRISSGELDDVIAGLPEGLAPIIEG